VIDGERMVWAAAFASARVLDGDDVTAAGRRADRVLAEYRESPWAREQCGSVDVEVALVDLFNDSESTSTGIASRIMMRGIKAEVERRIGRPLRGAK
jgi:hypothetical protein